MKLRAKHFGGMAALTSDVAYMCCGFALFSVLQTQRQMTISPLPWLLCVIAAYLLNCWLTRRSMAVNALIGINLLMVVGMAAVGCLYLTDAEGATAHLFALAFFIGSILHGYILAKDGVKPNQMLVYTEMSIVLIACFLCMELRDISLPADTFGMLFAAAGLDLMALIAMRVMSENSSRVEGSRAQGMFILLLMALLLGGIALGCLLLFSSAAQMAVGMFLTGAGKGLLLLGHFFVWLVEFLLSLFPAPEGELGGAPPGTEVTLPQAAVEEEADYTFIIILLSILAVASIVTVLVLLIRWARKKKTHGVVQQEALQEGELLRSGGLLLWLRRKLQELQRQYRFYLDCLRCRGSAQELLLRLERLAKKRGCGRLARESISCFLDRLANQAFRQDGNARELLTQLAGELERIFYSRLDAQMNRQQLRQLWHSLRGQLLPVEKNKAEENARL